MSGASLYEQAVSRDGGGIDPLTTEEIAILERAVISAFAQIAARRIVDEMLQRGELGSITPPAAPERPPG